MCKSQVRKTFIPTHILIGKQVVRSVESILPVQFSLMSYLYGCVIPDLSPRYTSVPHRLEPSLNLVSSLMDNTLHTTPQGNQEIQHYFTDLGIITHFICDYFCRPHNKAVGSGALSHAFYESRLALKCKYTDMANITTPFIIPYDAEKPARLLLQYLKYKHNEYLKAQPGMHIDISYSLQISTIIILNILCYNLTGLIHHAA